MLILPGRINAKLGGTTCVPPKADVPWLTQQRTMILGLCAIRHPNIHQSDLGMSCRSRHVTSRPRRTQPPYNLRVGILNKSSMHHLYGLLSCPSTPTRDYSRFGRNDACMLLHCVNRVLDQAGTNICGLEPLERCEAVCGERREGRCGG